MRQVIIIVLSIAFGAVSFWFFFSYLNNTTAEKVELDPTLQARLEAQRKVDEARQQPPPEVEERTEPDTTQSTTGNADVPNPLGVQTRGPFKIIGTDGHPASGSIELLESPEEKLVYYKNYAGTDGTALKVYLAKDLEAAGRINLGDVKGMEGDLVYGVPLDVNFNDYRYVLTWSQTAGVLYDYAEIK